MLPSQSHPDNPDHARLEAMVIKDLTDKKLLLSTAHTYHECYPKPMADATTRLVNPLARVMRHLPDIQVVSKKRLIGLDIKTNPDRNICIELLPVLETMLMNEDEACDVFYVYENMQHSKGVPRVIPISPSLFPAIEYAALTDVQPAITSRIRKLLSLLMPDVKIRERTEKRDPYLIINYQRIEDLQPWEDFLKTL